MELGLCEIEAIKAEIINSMDWSDEEEEDEKLFFCCGLFFW